MTVRTAFVHPETGRIRAGWRLLIFLVIFVAITAVLMIGTRALLGSLKRGSNLQFVLLAIGATTSVAISRKVFDRKSFISLGLRLDRWAVADLFSGIVNSALLMAGVYGLMVATGLIEFHGFTWWQTAGAFQPEGLAPTLRVIAGVVLQLTIVAWWEELVFRGYLLQNLADGTNMLWATVTSSLLFGFGHAFNPSATLLSSILIVAITPQLIYAYVKTGQLWLPIGLHLGWNFFQASVFGFAASGQASPSLISQSPSGPAWLSGGEFGAEGSILIIPFTLLSFVAIHYWVRLSRFPGQGAMEPAPVEGRRRQV